MTLQFQLEDSKIYLQTKASKKRRPKAPLFKETTDYLKSLEEVVFTLGRHLGLELDRIRARA